MGGHRSFLALIFAVLLSFAAAADWHKFKKCSDIGFCTRHRSLQDHHAAFEILYESIELVEGRMKAEIIDRSSSDAVLLTAIVTAYPGGIFRFGVQEKNGLRPRYFPTDSLADGLNPISIESIEKSRNAVTLTNGRSRLVLEMSPFKATLYSGADEVLRLNDRGLFMFEHYREKTPDAEKGYWEEKFKEHTDTKPFGPASFGLDVAFPNAFDVYGLPERTVDFSVPPSTDIEPYRFYNLDVFEFELDKPLGLYGSMPFVVAHSAKHTTGLLWLNAAETFVDVSKHEPGFLSSAMAGTHTHWFSESGAMELFLLPGPSPYDVFAQNAILTGTTAMPQYFSIAYHQCRWNYRDQEDVLAVDAGFDEHDIPMDVIWLDIEHTNGKKYFTWDHAHFPDPMKMQDSLRNHGRKLVTIIDPHLKREGGYAVHKDFESHGLYVKKNDGRTDFDGWCWPGSSSWPDFTNPDAQALWRSYYNIDKYEGFSDVLYTWNDMNEPSVFNGPEVTMQKDLVHYGGFEHRDVHNIYGMLVTKATAEGQSAGHGGNLRPFVLSRAFFPGSQRYCAVWTGDNAATWPHLRSSIPMLLSLGVSGMTFSGADVGGFFKDPDTELLMRWYQVAAFQPFYRAHAHLDTKRREPWLFGEEVTTNIRNTIRKRYAMLPYMYTLFRGAATSGLPVMRPLWAEFPSDSLTFKSQETFLLGPAVLVAPQLYQGGETVSPYLPGSEAWYDMETGAMYPGGAVATIPTPMDKLPYFQRAGTIVVTKQRPRRSTVAMAADPFSVRLVVSSQGTAEGELYLDDGATYDYTSGEFLHTKLLFSEGVLRNNVVHAGYEPAGKEIERVTVLGLTTPPRSVVSIVDGAAPAPVAATYYEDAKLLVLKKPPGLVHQPWSIKIE